MKHCYCYNFTTHDCKLFIIKRSEFQDFDDFLRDPGIRSVIDSNSCEYELMLKHFEECEGIETDKAWFKLLHLLFGFLDYDVTNAIVDNIAYKSRTYCNYEETAKMSLARYINLLRTGKFDFFADIHEELVEKMSVEGLVDLLEEELRMRTTIFQHQNSDKIIVKIAEYYYDYDALYQEYGVDPIDKNSEAYDKYIRYITTPKHTAHLRALYPERRF